MPRDRVRTRNFEGSARRAQKASRVLDHAVMFGATLKEWIDIKSSKSVLNAMDGLNGAQGK